MPLDYGRVFQKRHISKNAHEITKYCPETSEKMRSRLVLACPTSFVFREKRMRSVVESCLRTVIWHHHVPRLFQRWWFAFPLFTLNSTEPVISVLSLAKCMPEPIEP